MNNFSELLTNCVKSGKAVSCSLSPYPAEVTRNDGVTIDVTSIPAADHTPAIPLSPPSVYGQDLHGERDDEMAPVSYLERCDCRFSPFAPRKETGDTAHPNSRRGTPADLKVPQNESIFAALIRWEFSCLSSGEQYALFDNITGVRNFLFHDGPFGMERSWKSDSDIIEFTSKRLNISPRKAMVRLGTQFGLKLEFCFHSFPPVGDKFNTPRYCKEALPEHLVVDGKICNRVGVDYQQGFNGTREQAICHYRGTDEEFFLIACLSQEGSGAALKIGAAPAAAQFFSRTELARNSRAPAIICLDIRVAMQFRRMAREAKVLDHTGIIVSGCYEGHNAIKALNFDDLAGHSIILIPETSREGLLNVSEWAKRCNTAGAGSVAIYPWPIIPDCMFAFLTPQGSQEPWMQTLNGRAIHLDDIELPSKLAKDVCRDAISSEAYEDWTKEIGLIAKRANEKKRLGGRLNLRHLGDMNAEGHALTAPPSWDVLLSPSYSTMLWGNSNTGKSLVGIQLAIAVATGSTAFGITAESKRKVCYLDGEMDEKDFKGRCDQLTQFQREDAETLERNLFWLSMAEDEAPDIMSEEGAEIAIRRLAQEGVSVIFVDNLLSVAPNAAKGDNKGLSGFINRAKQSQIAVILLHHSGKDGNSYKGPADLGALRQNVLQVEGRDQLGEESGRNPKLKEALGNGQTTVRLTFEKCKATPQLERQTALYQLPVNGVWQEIEGWPHTIHQEPLPQPPQGQSDSLATTSVTAVDVTRDLPPAEKQIYDLLAIKNRTRKQLEKDSGFNADKVTNLLRSLIRQELVRRNGSGKATYYQLR